MRTEKPKLLAGGNPQIPKGYGDAPIEAYLSAVPGWKQQVCKALDRIICETVPGVEKAVKWNTPLYGMEKDVYFTGYHCMKAYVKVSFFKGALLDPPPPETSKVENVRYFHIREDDPIDEAQLADWMKQASKLPGEKM
ncbi:MULTISPECIES: DUF1801 domain-containing protein [Henriciella]|jgi:hypothetical protein|uniref:YdhG-like domain-containing protein n=1 Tax=Henriciella pelagia TaxID=1977912 RepID=A0ABQ1JUF8_9PROT|nr:DUF1801 domain-containing protein [Henriciella pelagia]GGB74824.1 hypothetical protein GCM10011503_24420 [Henriciella pelagia]